MASMTTLPLKFVGAGVGDRLLGGIAQHRQDEQLAVRGGLGERAGFDAGSIAGQPFAQLGLARVARADHHVVAATGEPGRQAPPDLAASQHANPALR